MKKLLGLILVATLAACSKQKDETSFFATSMQEIRVQIPRSRSTVQARDFENKLNSLELLVFNDEGKKVISRKVEKDEIDAGEFSIGVSKSMAQRQCTIYAIANSKDVDATLKDEMDALVEDDFASYQGNYDMVLAKALRPRGFSMSDRQEITLCKTGEVTYVNLSLRRTVARIELRLQVSEAFASKYPGKITPKKAEFGNGAVKSFLIKSEVPFASAFNASHTQFCGISEGQWNNLFYAYERSDTTPETLPYIKIYADYDNDGNSQTEDDISQMEYKLLLGENGQGIIKRNTTYAIDASITGLEGDELLCDIQIAQWDEAPKEELEIGK